MALKMAKALTKKQEETIKQNNHTAKAILNVIDARKIANPDRKFPSIKDAANERKAVFDIVIQDYAPQRRNAHFEVVPHDQTSLTNFLKGLTMHVNREALSTNPKFSVEPKHMLCHGSSIFKSQYLKDIGWEDASHTKPSASDEVKVEEAELDVDHPKQDESQKHGEGLANDNNPSVSDVGAKETAEASPAEQNKQDQVQQHDEVVALEDSTGLPDGFDEGNDVVFDTLNSKVPQKQIVVLKTSTKGASQLNEQDEDVQAIPPSHASTTTTSSTLHAAKRPHDSSTNVGRDSSTIELDDFTRYKRQKIDEARAMTVDIHMRDSVVKQAWDSIYMHMQQAVLTFLSAASSTGTDGPAEIVHDAGIELKGLYRKVFGDKEFEVRDLLDRKMLGKLDVLLALVSAVVVTVMSDAELDVEMWSGDSRRDALMLMMDEQGMLDVTPTARDDFWKRASWTWVNGQRFLSETVRPLAKTSSHGCMYVLWPHLRLIYPTTAVRSKSMPECVKAFKKSLENVLVQALLLESRMRVAGRAKWTLTMYETGTRFQIGNMEDLHQHAEYDALRVSVTAMPGIVKVVSAAEDDVVCKARVVCNSA